MYDKVNTDMDFAGRERAVAEFWRENKIFERSTEEKPGAPVFTFYDGPPTANGKPHIGHVLTRSVKDCIPRYRLMKGYNVLRKAGWDTHGLPVELEVERQLGLNGKPQIEEYGVEPFIKKCKESVWKYESEWRRMSDAVAFWADMDNPYVTYRNDYIESEWWALKTIFDKGLLYKGHRVVPYCPRCGTALSSHEVAQGYKDVTESSVFVKFRAEDEPGVFYLAWTTTPWTLPSNVMLCVNAGEDYAYVSHNGETLVLAAGLVGSVIGEGAEVVKIVSGAELEGKRYAPLFDFIGSRADAFYIGCDGYVTLSDGSGIVHIAPAFGEDDSRVGRKYGLPLARYVDERGNFTAEAAPWAGMFVKDGDPEIIEYLRGSGALFAAVPHEHSYPFCWRCDTPLLYYARSAWFIRVTAVRDRLVANNKTVKWYPETVGTGRFGNFLENVVDWSLSRERYWGTPLPIWECACGHTDAVGSIAELRARASVPVPEDIELHKPYIDKISIKCNECGGEMRRVPEVIDCWFDSGSMPFAQWHYPFENKEIFEARFPADFISEAVDQTRGWFYTLMAVSTLIFDRSPFRNCISLGHVLDKNGEKMSKHKGNVVAPDDVLPTVGADAVRWYFFYNSAPWLPSRFSEDAVRELQRKFMGTLWNTYAFYVLYANIDGFDPRAYAIDRASLTAMDRWLLSKLNALTAYADACLGAYKLTEPARAIADFVDSMSNWYVRRCRERFWAAGMERDKINAYMTLYTALETLSRLIAPFTPFMAEAMYRNLGRGEGFSPPEPVSVHLSAFPAADMSLVDPELERRMDAALDIVGAGRAARGGAAIKNRQPLSRMIVTADLGGFSDGGFADMIDIIKEELNVKSVEFAGDARRFSTYAFKPQLKTLGRKYGRLTPKIGQWLAEADGNALMDQLLSGGAAAVIDGAEVPLTIDDVLFERVNLPGFAAAEGSRCSVALDTTLTDELLEEGFVNELVSKIQTMRKEAGFEVMDHIAVTCEAGGRLTDVISRNAGTISRDVLASSVSAEAPRGFVKSWNINGEPARIGVEKSDRQA
ncbi:MAG: isoleucine--tRNA ligase [Clostridiales bacterium]|jgi:isoleucyl-tRNA synthetase|nr:isoleucine--tRNA ligase [Clostridiales bacterium]